MMRNKKLLQALLVVFSLTAISLSAAGCGLLPSNSSESASESEQISSSSVEEQPVYEFEGLNDVKLTTSATSYDYAAKVTAYKNFEEITFDVDDSAVEYGTPGEYSVTYKAEDYERTVKVYIYGSPTFTETGATITYKDVQTASALRKAVTAKDTFGVELTVSVVEGVQANELGYIEYGEHSVKFSATDSVGNTAEFVCNIIVSDADKPALTDIGIDLVDIQEVTQFDGIQINKIYLDGSELTSDDYSFMNGYLTFTESFLLNKELGDYTLLVITSNGYGEITLSITDNEDAKYSFLITDMNYQNELSFKKASLTSHQKNISFEYALETADGEAVTLSETEDGYTFRPGLDTSFKLTVTAKRGTEAAGVKVYPFTIQDDVYMWMVNRNNEKESVNFVLIDDAYEYGYSEEQSFNSLGSLKVSAYSGGCVQYLLYNVTNIAPNSTLNFYVYNPNGIALQAYVYNNSGYWANQNLAVCSNVADISAETGWQKVSLTLSAGFDGTLGGMSTFAENTSQAEIRIYNPDAWKWEDTETPFTLYTSNVYLETTHGMDGVSYDESQHQSTGVVTMPVELATASSTDGRHTFKYEISKGGTVLQSSNEEFTYTPTEEGEYTYTITSYWRGTQVGEKTYTITIGGMLALATNPYYQFDANGNVTLPAATCAIPGATLKYTVTNPAEEVVTLSSDLVYDTKKTHGTYIYKVEAIVENVTVAEASQTIQIHDGRVLIANGVGESGFKGSDMNMGTGTSFTFTTEEAAPGEIGCLKVDNTNQNYGELGNFNLQIGGCDLTGKTMLVFYIKHTSTNPIDLNMYGTFGGTAQFSINFWFDGTKYESWDNYPIQKSDEWQKVEVLLTNTAGTPVEGSDIRINFQSQGYNWVEGEQPVIYISNIYYV